AAGLFLGLRLLRGRILVQRERIGHFAARVGTVQIAGLLAWAVFEIKHEILLCVGSWCVCCLGDVYWQASQVGSSMAQARGATGAAGSRSTREPAWGCGAQLPLFA